MSTFHLLAFLPELVLLLGALACFRCRSATTAPQLAKTSRLRHRAGGHSWLRALSGVSKAHFSTVPTASIYFPRLSSWCFACGLALILLLSGSLEDIRAEVKPEYYLFLTISVTGLVMLVSCVDLITW